MVFAFWNPFLLQLTLVHCPCGGHECKQGFSVSADTSSTVTSNFFTFFEENMTVETKKVLVSAGSPSVVQTSVSTTPWFCCCRPWPSLLSVHVKQLTLLFLGLQALYLSHALDRLLFF